MLNEEIYLKIGKKLKINQNDYHIYIVIELKYLLFFQPFLTLSFFLELRIFVLNDLANLTIFFHTLNTEPNKINDNTL